MPDKKKIKELVEMCYYGHLDQIKMLLKEGIDVNAIDDETGMTPLSAAKDGANPEIAKYLLSIGAR